MAISTFKSKNLKKFFETGSKASIPTPFIKKIEYILDRLDAANDIKDMNFPGSNFHSLRGNLKNFYSVHINGNWTIIFRFEKGEAFDVELIDYH